MVGAGTCTLGYQHTVALKQNAAVKLDVKRGLLLLQALNRDVYPDIVQLLEKMSVVKTMPQVMKNKDCMQ